MTTEPEYETRRFRKNGVRVAFLKCKTEVSVESPLVLGGNVVGAYRHGPGWYPPVPTDGGTHPPDVGQAFVGTPFLRLTRRGGHP